MKTLELIGLCFGIGTCDTFLDDIAEKFDVDIYTDDIELVIDECGKDYSNVGQMLAERMFNQCLEEYDYQLYEDGWDADINGQATHLYCDGKEIHDIAELRGMAEFKKNVAHLEENCVAFLDYGYENFPYSAELECHTDAGEDMIINLEACDKKHLQDYIDGFDADEEVVNWWRNGKDAARKNGVPHATIADHYKDYEDYLEWLQGICDDMPY